jgi:dUTP pyrophosphatase
MSSKKIIQNALLSTAFQKYSNLMVLKIFIDVTDNNLIERYIDAVDKHNNKILTDNFPDAGFDMFAPDDILTIPGKLNKINFGIKCSAEIYTDNGNNSNNTGFYMYPRSSLSGTNLRLANSVGIIDSGYRGNLIGAFDCLPIYNPTFNSRLDSSNLNEYCIQKYTRLTQICGPGLIPIYVILVNSENELGVKTLRGEGGFGSTNL